MFLALLRALEKMSTEYAKKIIQTLVVFFNHLMHHSNFLFLSPLQMKGKNVPRKNSHYKALNFILIDHNINNAPVKHITFHITSKQCTYVH